MASHDDGDNVAAIELSQRGSVIESVVVLHVDDECECEQTQHELTHLHIDIPGPTATVNKGEAHHTHTGQMPSVSVSVPHMQPACVAAGRAVSAKTNGPTEQNCAQSSEDCKQTKSTIDDVKHGAGGDSGDAGGVGGSGGGASGVVADVWSSPLKSVLDVERGLSAASVDSQRAAHGWNESVEKKTPWYIRVVLKFWGTVPLLVEAAMIISFVLGEKENGAIIGFLLLVNAAIALHEEQKANRAVEELKEKLQILARCMRDGVWRELSSRELVPGDLIRVRHGDICPADVVVLEGHLEADQSALTGESELKFVHKQRVCYAGSIIKKGEASGIVWATGEKTFFGLTAKLVQNSKPSDHVQEIMHVFIKYFMSVIATLIVITLIILAVRREDIVSAIPLLLAVLITALPVALPVIFTVSMAVGSKTLSQHEVLVTRLNVLEDAPQMRILFSDKTGTLTLNKLSVQGLWCAPAKASMSMGMGMAHNDGGISTSVSCSSHELLLAAALCSRIENADPIDLAILKRWEEQKSERLEKSQGQSPADGQPQGEALFHNLEASSYECVRFLPFDAHTRRTDTTVVRPSAQGQGVEVVRVLKGAVSTICQLSGVNSQSLEWDAVQKYVTEASAKGFRTIAVCAARSHIDNVTVQQIKQSASDAPDGSVNSVLNNVEYSFRLLGIVALYDPPREDTLDTLKQLSDLGITTKMLTGDNHLVACEIARQLHFPGKIINLEEEKNKVRSEAAASKVNTDGAIVTEEWVLSQVFAKYPPLSDDISGFAQIFPADKHAIIQFAQSQGVICGMTGDGVNDAPALKAAEVGVAMSNATDIAKMAASACMLGEGLKGILSLVRVGRVVHRRTSVWLMYKVAKSLVHSIFILVFYLAIGYFPINTLQVILLLLLMDFALISIATDRQQGAAKPTSWPLLQYFRIGFVLGILGSMQMMGMILYADFGRSISESELNTLSFCLMFFFGFFNMLSCREKTFFWRSRPSTVIICLFAGESVAVALCCTFGLPGLSGLSAGWIFASIGVAVALFVLDDFVKGIYSIKFEKDFVTSG